MKLKIAYSDTLLQTMQEFSKASQLAYNYAKQQRISSLKVLHQQMYRTIREQTKLPSQLACKSIKFALETKRGCLGRKVSFSNPLAVQYDQRSYSFDMTGKCSLLTLDGRVKFNVFIPDYFKCYSDWDITSATLVKYGKHLFLNVVVAKEVGEFGCSLNSKTIGIDLGINNIATTSNRLFFDGGLVKEKLHRMRRLQEKLVAKGTKSAKRHLRELKGRRTRFMGCVNHLISKQIVGSANAGDVLVLENLKGIRGRRMGRELNTLLSNWSFASLKGMIEYKAAKAGILTVSISSAYTSKTCGRCHEIMTVRPRKGGFVKCLNCGYSCNADLNASNNLRSRADAMRNVLGLFVNQPIVGVDDFHDFTPTSPRPLVVGT